MDICKHSLLQDFILHHFLQSPQSYHRQGRRNQPPNRDGKRRGRLRKKLSTNKNRTVVTKLRGIEHPNLYRQYDTAQRPRQEYREKR